MAFYAVYDRIVPAANKYMATLFNTSATRKAIVQRVWRFNWQVAAVTGVQLEQELRFITARTAGTSVTAQTEDTNDTLGAGIDADTGSTSVTEASGTRGLIRRFFSTSEEASPGLGTMLGEDFMALARDWHVIWSRAAYSKGLVLRQNQGISVKNITSSTVGSVSYVIEFTDEPV